VWKDGAVLAPTRRSGVVRSRADRSVVGALRLLLLGGLASVFPPDASADPRPPPLRRLALAVGVDRFAFESGAPHNTDQGWARLEFARADAEAFAARM
jgi:hypothetical protein